MTDNTQNTQEIQETAQETAHESQESQGTTQKDPAQEKVSKRVVFYLVLNAIIIVLFYWLCTQLAVISCIELTIIAAVKRLPMNQISLVLVLSPIGPTIAFVYGVLSIIAYNLGNPYKVDKHRQKFKIGLYATLFISTFILILSNLFYEITIKGLIYSDPTLSFWYTQAVTGVGKIALRCTYSFLMFTAVAVPILLIDLGYGLYTKHK